MFSTPVISIDEARMLMDTALDLARRDGGAPVAAAVVDPSGELVAFARLDGTPGIAIEIAINKAYTAARTKRPTRALAEQMRNEQKQLEIFGDARLTYFHGGVPVIAASGDVAGGLGVSGRAEEDDDALAAAALTSLNLDASER